MKLREDGHTGCGVGLCLSSCLRLWWRLQAHRELRLQNLAGGGGYAPGCLAARPSVLRWDPLTWCPSEECCVLGSALGASGGDALAPLGGDGPDRAHRHLGPPGVVSRQVQDSYAFLHRASEQQLVCANLLALLQVLPTPPAAPPCTRSAPSAASTWWASAQSPTACTSARTPSPARTSGTRPWLSPAAAPTPVSSTSGPVPLSCGRWGGLFW